jgi:hypothetical protein
LFTGVGRSRDSIFRIATRLRTGQFRFRIWERNFSLLRSSHTSSGSKTASYSMGTGVPSQK